MKKQYKTLIIAELLICIFFIIIAILINNGGLQLLPRCIFYQKLGIFCLSCGGTKFVENLFAFKIWKAFLAHPMFFILAVYLSILNLIYIINVVFDKKIKLFKYWHIIIWTICLVLYTIIKNII